MPSIKFNSNLLNLRPFITDEIRRALIVSVGRGTGLSASGTGPDMPVVDTKFATTPAEGSNNRPNENSAVYGNKVVVLGSANCGFSNAATSYLSRLGVPVERVNVTSTQDPVFVRALASVNAQAPTGGVSTPIILHSRGEPRLTEGLNTSDLGARYAMSGDSRVGGETPVGTDTTTTAAFRTDSSVPGVYTFSAPTSTSTSARTWDFGDGTSSTEMSPTHMYSAPGNYVVTLIVDGVRTTSVLPVVLASSEAEAVQLPFTITPSPTPGNYLFSAQGDAPRSWDFGDGSPISTELSPSHTYVPGTYTVLFTQAGGSPVGAALVVPEPSVREPLTTRRPASGASPTVLLIGAGFAVGALAFWLNSKK